MVNEWTTDVLSYLSDVEDGKINNNIITFVKGEYNSSANRIDGINAAEVDPDFVLDFKFDIPVGCEITKVEITAEWHRYHDIGGTDRIIQLSNVIDSVENFVVTYWDGLPHGGSVNYQGSGTLNAIISESGNSITVTGQGSRIQEELGSIILPMSEGELTIMGHLDDDENSGTADYLRYTTVKITGRGINPFISDATDQEDDDCDFGNHAENDSASGQPISYRTGEKREKVTDLWVNTPAGQLAFTRSFRQNKLTGDGGNFPQQMGLGWSHNHNIWLHDDISNSNEIYVYMPSGGRAHFEEGASSTEYVAKAGGTSKITIDSGSTTARYMLETTSQIYVFDSDGNLQTRTWSNSEVWTYSYYSTSDYKDGLLEKVDDGYGRELQFSYIDNSGQFDHQQLWRVGDQDSSDLDTGSPSGRYVEFGYVEEKSNNTVVTNAEPLLHTVKDVLGEAWTYDYYGQGVGETDTNQLNWLTEYQSPSVDTDGDGTVNNSLTLKRLSYVFDGSTLTDISEEMGIDGSDVLLTTEFAFQPNGNNITTETTGGKTLTHYFSGENYAGAENAAGNSSYRSIDNNYRNNGQQDANGNVTEMEWSSNGKTLSSVTDANSNTTSFTYDSSDRLLTITDAEGLKTVYTYDVLSSGLHQPEIIEIKDASDNLLRKQTFVYDAKGRVTDEKEVDGTTDLRHIEREYYGSTGNGAGLLKKVSIYNLDDLSSEDTTYTYDSAGQVIQVQNSSTFGNCLISRTLYDNAGNVVASICNYDDDNGTHSAPTESTIDTWYTTVGIADKNQVTTHAYDTMGRRVSTTTNTGNTAQEKTSRVIYDALGRVICQIANYKNPEVSSVPTYKVPKGWTFREGVWKDEDASGGTPISHGTDLNENIISRTEYNDHGLVRWTQDHLGRVILYGYDDVDHLVKTVQNASMPNYDNTFESGDMSLSTYGVSPTMSTDSDKDIITEQSYDAVGNLVKTVDSAGRVTYTMYDALNRPVKMVANAKDTATVDLNEGETGYDPVNDPRSSAYVILADPDRDQISETEYDSLGRAVEIRRILDKYDTTETWNTVRVVYDKLGRQSRIIQNYVAQTSEELPDLWIWDDTANQWTESNGTTVIEHGANDRNLITETFYNEAGQVSYTRDSEGREMHYAYDGLQRQNLSVANFMQNDNVDYQSLNQWAWDTTNGWADDDTSGNPIEFGDQSDQNIISGTSYDDNSYVKFTRDADGRVTQFVYDQHGRQILNINNYVLVGSMIEAQDTVNMVSNWFWNDSLDKWEDGAGHDVEHGSNFDQNIIFETIYDDYGRVQASRDYLGNVTLYGYDSANRRIKVIQTASDPNYDVDSDPDLSAYTGSSPDDDQDRISTTTYDVAGRVASTIGTDGNTTTFVYDELERLIRMIQNYVSNGEDPSLWVWDEIEARWEESDGTAIVHTSAFDENLITEMVYDKADQVITTRDARGTQTSFNYDDSGRRVSVIQAANAVVASTSYTCYDKAGRVLRMIANWQDDGADPDERDSSGDWVFNPTTHGSNNDQNLMTEYEYDNASRRVKVINANSDDNQTSYFKDGTVDTVTDFEDVVTAYRYDGLRRRTRVIQNFVDNGEDPSLWIWDGTTDNRWEESDGTLIAHGTNNDQNIIVDVSYDVLGRMTQLRDPRGNVTSYEFDLLGRRTKLTNPLSKEWVTAYANVGNVTQTTMTYPGINGSGTYDVVRDFDRLGRLTEIDYDDLSNTPTIQFTYDSDGNRQKMTEIGSGSSTIRETIYGYDELGRLTSVGFDTDGDTTINETVSYEYDIAGNRTKLTLPGSDDIIYAYDDKGRLTSMTDWEGHITTFQYDDVNRHVGTQRSNGFYSRYAYNPAGHLRELRHGNEWDTVKSLRSFVYTTDKRGNRTQVQELTFRDTAGSSVTIAHDDPSIVYQGDWDANGNFHETTTTNARLAVMFYGNTSINLTMGTGDDCGIYDVYINKTLWQSYDGYAASAGEDVISIEVKGDGAHLLEVFQRREKNSASDGYKVRFKQLTALSAYDTTTIAYTYDDIERLLEADYVGSARNYKYTYDLAGNRLSEQVNNGAVTNYTYNNANQLTGDGTNTYTYDNNGNLTNDGANSYTWDRANRLLSRGSNSYAYNGDGQRISQTVSATVTKYLLDIQPGLEVVLRETTGSDVESFVYDNRGMVHSQQKANSSWRWMAEDGLGSIRSVMDDSGSVVSSSNYAPYGSPFDVVGGGESPFGYTGEYTDSTGDVFLRARYYNPSMGTFNSRDPFEGYVDLPMSINGYGYVHGNPVNLTDPSGMFAQILVGALGGLAFGTIMGYAQGTLLYHMSISGACGCEKQQEASRIGEGEFVRQSTAIGALMGAAMGALATIPGGGMLLAAMNVVENVEIATKLAGILEDFTSDGDIDDWCPVAELIFDIVTERVTNKLADGAPKRKRDVNRSPDADAPRMRRNGQADPNQRRGGCSFSPDTIVATQDGDKLISEVEVGDLVMGYSEVAGAVSFMHVTATHNELHESTLDVTIDGEVVHTTDEHPFFVVKDGEGEWVKAKDLQVGDVIFNTMGKDGIVEVVEVVDEPQLMYNLSVQLVASYFVGDGQWLVHNVEDCELFYRAMSETEYKRVDAAGGLVKRPEGSNELFVTTSKEYIMSLINRRGGQRRYPAAVEFELEIGTLDMLFELGATHNSASSDYPHLPSFESGMDAVQIKFERLGNISIPSFAVGHSVEGLKQFNEMIRLIRRLER